MVDKHGRSDFKTRRVGVLNVGRPQIDFAVLVADKASVSQNSPMQALAAGDQVAAMSGGTVVYMTGQRKDIQVKIDSKMFLLNMAVEEVQRVRYTP